MTHQPMYAYLGPAGTFSDAALRDFVAKGRLSADYQGLPCETMAEVFEAVDRSQVDYGVVPIENSLEGSVTSALDAFAFSSRAEILGETVLPIHQALIGAPGASIEDVKAIVSHPQGIGQCRRFISSKLPGRQIRLSDSTAAAVQEAAQDPAVAAIGSPLAAQIYGGEIFEEAIEDNLNSQTRFVLIGQHENVEHTGRGKTSIVLFMKEDRPGTLNMILSEFAFAQVNLTMVQSRPTKRDLGDYMFFMDIDGYADDPDIRVALDCLRLKLREVRVIGTYPSCTA